MLKNALLFWVFIFFPKFLNLGQVIFHFQAWFLPLCAVLLHVLTFSFLAHAILRSFSPTNFAFSALRTTSVTEKFWIKSIQSWKTLSDQIFQSHKISKFRICRCWTLTSSRSTLIKKWYDKQIRVQAANYPGHQPFSFSVCLIIVEVIYYRYINLQMLMRISRLANGHYVREKLQVKIVLCLKKLDAESLKGRSRNKIFSHLAFTY